MPNDRQSRPLAEIVELSMVGGELRITVVAEKCDDCGERVRYWNDGGGEPLHTPGASGCASCGCTQEGPESCDVIMLRPVAVRIIREAARVLGILPRD